MSNPPVLNRPTLATAPLGKAVVAAPTPEMIHQAQMYQRKLARYTKKSAAARIVGQLAPA